MTLHDLVWRTNDDFARVLLRERAACHPRKANIKAWFGPRIAFVIPVKPSKTRHYLKGSYMPMLSDKYIANFRRENGAEFYKHQQVMAERRRQHMGAEDAAPAPVLSRSALIIEGALLRELRPRLAADATLNLGLSLRGVNARNLRSNKQRIIADINRQCGHKIAYGGLDKLGPLIDALSMERSLVAADACDPGHQAFRAHNFESRPTAHDVDTEVAPHERGTGGYLKPEIPEQEAIDEYQDENGMANKAALTKGVGQKLSGETRVRVTREGAENNSDFDVNKIVQDAVAAAMKDFDPARAQLMAYQRKSVSDGYAESGRNAGFASSEKISGDEPGHFEGAPRPGGAMDNRLGGHIECLDAAPRLNESWYSKDLRRLSAQGHTPQQAHQKAVALAHDRSMKYSDKPSWVFEQSGAGKIPPVAA